MKTHLIKSLLNIVLILSFSYTYGENIFVDFSNKKLPKNWIYVDKIGDNININTYFNEKYYQTSKPSFTILFSSYLATDKISNISYVEFYLCSESNLDNVFVEYSTGNNNFGTNVKWNKILEIDKSDIVQKPEPGQMTKFNIDLSNINQKFYLRFRSVGVVLIDDIKFTDKSATTVTEINSDLNKKIDLLNSGDKIKINLSLTGLFSYNGFLYAATDPGQCSFPSINKSTTKHNHDDNPLNFEQKDWIKIKINNPEQYVGKTFSKGILASINKEEGTTYITPDGTINIDQNSTNHNRNTYEADNFYGSVSNDFKVKPQDNEIATAIGFFKEENGNYWLYNGRSKQDIILKDPDNLVSSDMLNSESKGEYRSVLVLINKVQDNYSLTMLKRLDNPTSVNLNANDNIIVSTINNKLEIMNCLNCNITIYNINGKLINQTNSQSSNHIEYKLDKGFYIVKCNSKVYKILIN